MPEILYCERCHSRLPAKTPPGFCSTCLLEFGVHGYSESSPRPPAGSQLQLLGEYGDYQLLEEIARGGMGVVCRARQKSLNRIVAVKLILIGQWAGEAHVERFKAEAEAAARLDHPNIVPIYDIGEEDGQHYFSMKLIEGESLAEFLKRSPSQESAARLVVKIARAVHYAHQHRVLHRDLKPTNILIDARGEPHLTDFGLAKVIERGSSLTHTAAILGTPNYMAPEQASGKAKYVTTAADVYSLGAILYELLAGRPPFVGESPLETLNLVRESEPTPPRSLQPHLARDLETICLKCLRKEPERRYGSSEALADDLELWIQGKPVLARPAAAPERLWLWVWRKPAVAALAGAMTVLVVATAIGSTIMAFRIAAARDEARRHAEQNREQLVRLNAASGVKLLEAGDYFAALPWLGEALRQEDGVDDRETAHRMRIRAVLRECPQLEKLWLHEGFAAFAAFSPEGDRVVTCGFDGVARVWDIRTGQPLTPPMRHQSAAGYRVLRVRHADWSADGLRLVTVCNDRAQIWDAKTGLAVGGVLQHGNEIASAVFNPGGDLILTASFDRTARLWDARTGESIGEPVTHPSAVTWAVFSPGGLRFATATQAHHAQVWDSKTMSPVGPALVQAGGVRRVTFSPDGSRLVTSGNAGIAQIWDVETGEPIGAPMKHHVEVRFAVFSADGRRVATAAGDRSARVWDATSGAPIIDSLVHKALVDMVQFSPDGLSVITGSFDNTARVWNAQTGDPLTPPLPHNHVVAQVAFHPGGKLILTVSSDGGVRLWALPVRERAAKPVTQTGDLRPLAFSRDGVLALCLNAANESQVWHLPSMRPITKPLSGDVQIEHATFSWDGTHVLIVGTNLKHQLWHLGSGELACPEWQTSACDTSPVFSPDERHLAASMGAGEVRIYDTLSGHRTVRTINNETDVRTMAFSSDGQFLALGGHYEARIWRTSSGEAVSAPLAHEAEMRTVNFSADGNWLASASQDGVVKVWGTANGCASGPVLPHPRAVVLAVFDSKGSRLLTVCDDKKVRVWDWVSGKLVAPPLEHDNYVKHVAFSHGGTRLVTIDEGLRIRTWDLGTGQQITLPDRRFQSFSGAPDWPWDTEQDDRPVGELLLDIELLSGRRIDGQSGLVPLSRQQLAERWKVWQTRSVSP